MANIQLTQELVKYLFDYKDGFLYWKVKTGDKVVIGKRSGAISYRDSGDRYVLSIYKTRFLQSRTVFLWHNGWLPEIVDHENHNTTDDRIENLRAANDQLNNKNCTSAKGSSSQYLGVQIQSGKYWIARITVDYKSIYIGCFKTESEAALAHNKAAVRLHKEFANLNVVKVLL